MAKLKMKRLPKKPKRSASVETKINWLKRADEVKRENARRAQENKKSAELSRKISAYRLSK